MKKFLLILFFLPISFGIYAQYLTESFEGAWSGTPAAPSGWSIQHTTATGTGSGTDPTYWVKNTWSGSAWSPTGHGTPTTPTGAYDGSSVAWFDDYNAKATQKDELRTGDVDLSSSTNPRVTFYLAINASSSVTVKLRGSSDGGSNWADIQTITKPGVAWTKIAVAIPGSYKVANARFGVEITATYGSYDIWLDKFVVEEVPTPLTGIKTIKAAGGDYATFTAAINALNDAGVGAGGVTFNADADLVSTEDPPAITATGTAANPIIFQKSGSGANPIIKPTGTVGSTDAGIKIAGGDYITFDGIDITIATGSAVEYGYYIYNASATNGAQNNTIKNSKITLNRSNTSSCGIYQYTATTPTNQGTGNNNNNKYYNITIENVYTGIYLKAASSTYYDAGCEVGITGTGTTTIGASSANDIGNGSSAVYGIRASYQSGVKIFNATVRNLTCTSSSTRFSGIFLENTYGTSAVYNNIIGPVTGSSTSSSTTNYLASGMRLDVASLATVNVYNNFIFGITTGQTSATTSAPSSVIQATGIAMGVTTGTSNLYYNSIRIEGSTYINSACVTNTGGANTMIFKDNVFANFTAAQTGTPKHYGIMRQGSSGTISKTDYNDYYIPNSGNGYVGYYTSDRATLADWQAVLTPNQDQNSKDKNPSFASSTDLHSSSPDLNGAGVTISVANSDALDITTDIDGVTRGTPPDIGADEFTLNDMTSKVEAPGTQVTGTTIASTVNVVGDAVEVFRFKITDMGPDGLATIVTNVRITNADPANGASWTGNIAGLKLNDGTGDITIGTPTIAASYIDIPITSGNLDVADASSKTITLSVYLKTSGIEDGKKLQFTVPATSHGFTASAAGSIFASDFGAAVTGNEHTITVTATKLLFSGVPATALINSNFSSTVSATDANGNTDIDNTTSVTLSRNTGTGALSSITGLTQSLVSGTKTWTDLQYDMLGIFRMQADGGSLTQGVTGDITCSNTIIIGTSTTVSQAYPFDVLYGYSRNAALYTSSEIGAYLTLDKLAWQVATARTTDCPVKVYLKKTSATTIAADTWANMISGATLVYDGTLQFTPSGWYNITFSSSFDYDADNLLVLTEGNYGGGGTGTYPTFYYTTASNMNANQRTDDVPPTGNLTVGSSRPNLKITIPVDMSYLSSTATQTVVTSVNAGATSQQVIGIQVVVAGDQNPLSLTKLVVNANGTTSVSDISNAKVWYTGTSSTFATSSQFGSTVAAPTTANFDVTGNQALSDGTNYFWLTYDIASTAVNANVIDGECTSVTVGGSDHVPTVTAPGGTRAIINKTLTSITGNQATTAFVLRGATDQPVLRLDFLVAGPAGGSLLMNSIAATYTGTIASDIAASGVKLYWTTTTSFATTNLLGTAQSLSGGVATFSGLNYNLPTGTTYIWVAFDIGAEATIDNTVDAKIAAHGIDVAGTTYNDTDIDPAGTRTIKAALAGTYTVGTGGNYTSFTKTDGLFADINALGFSGNVTINVVSDITDETGATALNQWAETGAGNYTLTIQSDAASLRTISGTYLGGLIRLNGADRVTINGNYSGSGQYLLFSVLTPYKLDTFFKNV